MTETYEPPERRCENCAHAREVEGYAVDGEWTSWWMCEARKPHRTEAHHHCNDWEEKRDEP